MVGVAGAPDVRAIAGDDEAILQDVCIAEMSERRVRDVALLPMKAGTAAS